MGCACDRVNPSGCRCEERQTISVKTEVVIHDEQYYELPKSALGCCQSPSVVHVKTTATKGLIELKLDNNGKNVHSFMVNANELMRALYACQV